MDTRTNVDIYDGRNDVMLVDVSPEVCCSVWPPRPPRRPHLNLSIALSSLEVINTGYSIDLTTPYSQERYPEPKICLGLNTEKSSDEKPRMLKL